MTESEFFSTLATVRRHSAARRASAWAVAPERVLGLPLRPVTLATFDLLHGTENAFVCGLPPVEADVKNFILYHSPEFDPDRPAPRIIQRLRIALRTERALCPLATPPAHRARLRAASFRRALGEIRAILDATWADALPPNEDDDAGPAVAAALHAQLVDLLAREYATWPLGQPLRHTPLAQLFQLARAIERHHLGRHAVYFDRDEAAVIRDYLAAANAAAPIRSENP